MSRSDQEAVQAALKDPDAFSLIVAKYHSPLLRYIQRVGIPDAEVAKDVLQEAFIKIYLNLNDYDDALPFSSWIYRIAHNEAMRYFRFMKHRPQAPKEEEVASLYGAVPDELDVTAESESRIRAETLATALGALAEKYREVIVLRFFEEKSYDEIADILQLSPGTVATNLARGKLALKGILERSQITGV